MTGAKRGQKVKGEGAGHSTNDMGAAKKIRPAMGPD